MYRTVVVRYYTRNIQMNILLPNNGTTDIIQDTLPTAPDGFYHYWCNDTQWTLQDGLGRINVSWVYTEAKNHNPSLTNKKPSKWLANIATKTLRSNYLNLIGYDPVCPIHAKDAQFLSGCPNSATLSTQGTYMTDRMFLSYAIWVSFEFQTYALDIVLRNSNNVISPQSLILSTDILHQENDAINQRHGSFILNSDSVATNLKAPNLILRNIKDYVVWLRNDFNISISVAKYLKYMCSIGVMYKDGLHMNGILLDMYKPKQDYLVGTPLFATVSTIVNGLEVHTVLVTELGHNATIQGITNNFSQIETK